MLPDIGKSGTRTQIYITLDSGLKHQQRNIFPRMVSAGRSRVAPMVSRDHQQVRGQEPVQYIRQTAVHFPQGLGVTRNIVTSFTQSGWAGCVAGAVVAGAGKDPAGWRCGKKSPGQRRGKDGL